MRVLPSFIMNKNRIEAFSDGVFAIVMTLLIIDIKVPPPPGISITDKELWHRIFEEWPLFRSYFITFIVIGMYWIFHHSLFHMFAKAVNRVVNVLNIWFLMFVTFVPFSAHLLGQYPHNSPSFIIYTVNIVLIGLIFYIMFCLVVYDKNLVHEAVTPRLIAQATIRVLLTPGFAVLALFVAPWDRTLSFFLYGFPIVFNLIPGTLNFVESVFLFPFKLFTRLKKSS